MTPFNCVETGHKTDTYSQSPTAQRSAILFSNAESQVKLHAKKRTMEKKKRQKELETARTHVKVYLSPDEKAVIKKKADSFGMTISNYLKTVGCGYEPLDKLSFQKVDDLLKVAGTVGKFTGLLKILLREQNTHRIETSRKQIEKDYREAVKCVADIKEKVKHVCDFDEPEDIDQK